MAESVDVTRGGGATSGLTEWDAVVREIYRRDHDRVVGFFVRRTRDRGLAEDLAHDTFVRLSSAAERLDPDRPVWPYLRAIAGNVLVDHQRRESRQVELDVEEELLDKPIPGDDLDDTVVLRTLLESAIADLTARQRVAVELRCERGWNVAESAEFLGMDSGAFRQLLYRARRNLRAALDESGARLGGIIGPALVWLRVRTRSASVRVREVGQNPASAVSLDSLASAMVAATLGVAAAAGAPAWADPSVGSYGPALELVRQEAALSAAPTPAAAHELPIGAPRSLPAEQIAAPAGEDVNPPVAHAGDRTVVEAPDAVLNSKARVAVEDDGERFGVTHHILAQTGAGPAMQSGDVVSTDCNNLIGEVLCSSEDGLGEG